MQTPLRSCLVGFFLLIFFSRVEAQKIYADSLEKILMQADVPKEDKVVILCKLARASFEKNLPLSFKRANEALHIGASLSDGRGKAMAFATLIHLYVRQKDMQNAYKSRDSAQYYASRTTDRIAKGFVLFRSGWLDMINDENDKAIVKLLKALDFYKGQQADEYESNSFRNRSDTSHFIIWF